MYFFISGRIDVMASGGLGVCSHGAVDFCLFEVGEMPLGMLLAGWEDGLEFVCDGLVILFECGPSYKRIWCPLPSVSLLSKGGLFLKKLNWSLFLFLVGFFLCLSHVLNCSQVDSKMIL